MLCVAAKKAQKVRKEVAAQPAAGKDEWAWIRGELIILEVYLVEAMEFLELYCDLLLAQFSLIQITKWDLLNLYCFSGSEEWQGIPCYVVSMVAGGGQGVGVEVALTC